MASVKGELVTCDRCGKNVFLKLIGKDYYDGGYSSADKFEEMPKGWKRTCVEVYRWLCPECSEAWEELCIAFMERENIIITSPREVVE